MHFVLGQALKWPWLTRLLHVDQHMSTCHLHVFSHLLSGAGLEALACLADSSTLPPIQYLISSPSGRRYTDNLTPWCSWCFIKYDSSSTRSLTLCTDSDGMMSWSVAASASWLVLQGAGQTSVCPAGWIASVRASGKMSAGLARVKPFGEFRIPENRTASASPAEERKDACPLIIPGLSDNIWSQTNLWVKRQSIRTVHENNIDYKTLKLVECEKYTGWVGGEHHGRSIKKYLKSVPILLTPVFCNLCCCSTCVVRPNYIWLN